MGQAYRTAGKLVKRRQGGSLELMESPEVTIRVYREVGAAQRWFSLSLHDELQELEIFVPMEALQGEGERTAPVKAAVFVD